MKKPIDLEIIITTYNSQFWLKKTLATLMEYVLAKTKLSIEVIVVDNNSSDATLPMLRKEFAWVQLVQLSDNHGFAFANNRVLEKSTARYCMLLNSDVESTEHSDIDTLIDYADERPNVGIVSPKLEFSDGKLDPACHRGEPTLWAAVSYFSGLEKQFPASHFFGQYHQMYKDLNSVHTVDACSGAAMIVRRAAIVEVGLLDEQFFMYAEDLDWCRRFRAHGYQVVYNPESRFIHHKNKSGIKSSSQTIARSTRKHFYNTMIQYYDKHYSQQYPGWLRTFIRYILIIKQGAI